MNKDEAEWLFIQSLKGTVTDKGFEYKVRENPFLLNPSTLRYIERVKRAFLCSTIMTNSRESKKYYKEVPVMQFTTTASIRNYLELIDG